MNTINQQGDDVFDFAAFGADRPYEFRAWHVPTQSMVMVDSFSSELIIPRLEMLTDEPVQPLARVDCILMQFVGRSDATGNPMCEGDIVRLQHQRGPGLPTAYYHQYVGFWQGSFILIDINERVNVTALNLLVFDRLSTIAEEPINCVVVGNVYRDRSLLDVVGLIDEEPTVSEKNTSSAV